MASRLTRVLLVAPAFHGYGRSISGALTRAGYRVRLHEYDLNPTALHKVRHKISYEMTDRLAGTSGSRRHARRITATAVTVLVDTAPDVVLTVKADVLDAEYWAAVDSSGARQLLWLYDEVARMTFDPEVLATRPSIVSYSPHDVRTLSSSGIRAAHVLDAFDHTIAFTPRPSADVVFVGARYAERDRLMHTLHRAGVPVRAYGRDWSGHPLDRLRTWRFTSPDVPTGRDVPRSVAYGIIAGSAASLNSHSDQDGFTMRTYEIPGAGGLQLIDRPDVAELYDPGTEVLVFRSDDELIELCRRAGSDHAWARAIAERSRRRTLADHTFDHRVPVLEAAWD